MSASPVSPGDRAAREAAVIKLVSSWSAGAQPDLAPLLRAIDGVPRAPDLLRSLNERAFDLLPDELRRDIGEALSVMGAGATLRAPSFRARLDQLLSRAADALRRRFAERGAAAAKELGSLALLLDRDQFNSALAGLWRAEGARRVADLLEVHDEVARVESALRESRAALAADLKSPGGPADRGSAGNPIERARAAAASGDPIEMYHARLILNDLGARARQDALAKTCDEARARLGELCSRAKARLSGAGGDAGGMAGRLLAAAVESAERAALAEPESMGGAEACLAALAAWERALRTLTAADPASSNGALRERQSVVLGFQSQIERLLPSPRAAGAEGQSDLSRRAAAAARALGEAATEGGRTFPPAVERAAALLQEARVQAEGRVRAAASRLESAAGDLRSFLEKTAEQLPTARVVAARLRLEQVAGIVAAADPGAIEDVGETLRGELEELRRLATQAQRRRSSRAEAERSVLESETADLESVAPRRIARRLAALSTAIETADEDGLALLRDRVERLRGTVEGGLRLRAARILHAGRRAAPSGGAKAGKPSGRSEDLARSLDALAGALQKDDLSALRQCAAAARAAHEVTSVTARRWFRPALIGAAALLLAAAFWGWRLAGDRPQTYHLRLTAQPPSPVSLWLVRDGKVVRETSYGGGSDGVSFDLDPGRYEVFVNERYTGRVIAVPGEREVSGIPLPAAAP